ncbi:MAG TPA: hypothetical protein VL137_05530 [Polyangiaceae bacterium]|nr:hypothetical protein [Polyangiaceae bacterium]
MSSGGRGGSGGATTTRGGTSAGGTRSGSGGSTAGTTASGGTTATDGSAAGDYGSGCPAAVPADGAACTSDHRVCSYGDAPRGDCREVATCNAGQWTVQHPMCMQPSPPADCPAQPPAAMATCAQDQQLCDYSGGTECVCFSNLGWVCDSSTSSRGCPNTPPNAGTTCTNMTQQCSYNCGLLGTHYIAASCDADGVWTWSETPCVQTN